MDKTKLIKMRAYKVSKPGLSTLVRTDDIFSVVEEVESLDLKEGDNFRTWVRQNQTFILEEINYYNLPYTEEDKLEILLEKSKSLRTLVETFELECT